MTKPLANSQFVILNQLLQNQTRPYEQQRPGFAPVFHCERGQDRRIADLGKWP
jgi:hypothetical protein